MVCTHIINQEVHAAESSVDLCDNFGYLIGTRQVSANEMEFFAVFGIVTPGRSDHRCSGLFESFSNGFADTLLLPSDFQLPSLRADGLVYPIPGTFNQINDFILFTCFEAEKEACKRWPNQTHIVVKGHHNLQEDSANEIGAAIALWLREHR